MNKTKKQIELERFLLNSFKDFELSPADVIMCLSSVLSSGAVLLNVPKEHIIEIIDFFYDGYQEVGNKLPSINKFWKDIGRE